MEIKEEQEEAENIPFALGNLVCIACSDTEIIGLQSDDSEEVVVDKAMEWLRLNPNLNVKIYKLHTKLKATVLIGLDKD